MSKRGRHRSNSRSLPSADRAKRAASRRANAQRSDAEQKPSVDPAPEPTPQREQSTTGSTNPVALQRGHADTEQGSRPDNEQDRKQEPPLPIGIIKPGTDRQKQDETETPDCQKNQSHEYDGKAHISRANMFRKEMVGAWRTADGGDKWIIALTGAIVLMAIVTGVINGCQWNVTRGQLKQMKDASRLDSRAWVGYVGGIMTEIKAGQPVQATIELKNTGKTPAFNLRVRHNIVPESLSCDMNAHGAFYEDEQQFPPTSQTPLPPNCICTASTPPAEVTPEVLERLNNGTAVIYVFGVARYDDHLGGHHTTRYCHVWDPKTKRLTAHRQYNCMD